MDAVSCEISHKILNFVQPQCWWKLRAVVKCSAYLETAQVPSVSMGRTTKPADLFPAGPAWSCRHCTGYRRLCHRQLQPPGSGNLTAAWGKIILPSGWRGDTSWGLLISLPQLRSQLSFYAKILIFWNETLLLFISCERWLWQPEGMHYLQRQSQCKNEKGDSSLYLLSTLLDYVNWAACNEPKATGRHRCTTPPTHYIKLMLFLH